TNKSKPLQVSRPGNSAPAGRGEDEPFPRNCRRRSRREESPEGTEGGALRCGRRASAGRRETSDRGPPRKARAPADLAGRIDAERLQETQIFDVDPEGRLLGNSPAAVVGLGRRLPPPRPGARRAAIDADLRVENHV